MRVSKNSTLGNKSQQKMKNSKKEPMNFDEVQYTLMDEAILMVLRDVECVNTNKN